MSAVLFKGGTIWTGSGDTDAVLVSDGIVRAVGAQAREHASGGV